MDRLSDWPPAARVLAALCAGLLLAALWSVLASTIFLVGTRLLTRQTVPLVQFWTYLGHYGLAHPVVGLWLKLSAGGATAVPAFLLAARLARRGWPGRPSRPLHGRTRWAGFREQAAGDLRAKTGGLYVGQDGFGRYLRFGGPEHLACYAPTRSGKGVGLVIPNCLLYEATLVCLDVKHENWAASAGIRAEAGQKVFLFDPLAPDGRTARYNPFDYVRRGTVDAFDDIQRIAQMVFPHVPGDQQFWTDSARSAFTGVGAFLAESDELPLTFGEVLRLLSDADGPTRITGRIEARRQAGRPYTEATVRALDDYLRGSADLVNSIRKTVTARLSLWFNPRIDAATAASDFDLRTLRSSLQAVYVGVTPDNIARLRPLLALFFQQLVDLTVRTLPRHGDDRRHQVLMLLDEFPLLGPMPVLADAFAFVAGYGMRLVLVMQSKAQLRDRALYGPDGAAAILDNCGLEVVFGTKDHELARELSQRLGDDTVEARSRSGPAFWRAFRRERLSVTDSDRARPLLLPQEIARLDPREAILLRPGMLPVRCRRIRHYRDPTFARLLRPPPAIEPIDIDLRLDPRPATVSVAAAPAPAPAEPAAVPAPPASPKRKPRRKPAGGAAPAAGPPQAPAAAPAPAPGPPLQPHQSDGLLAAIQGADVDFSSLGLADGKAVVARLLDRVPTVGSLSRDGSRAT